MKEGTDHLACTPGSGLIKEAPTEVLLTPPHWEQTPAHNWQVGGLPWSR